MGVYITQNRLSKRMLSVFCLQLALLMDASIPPAGALDILSQDAPSAQERTLFRDLSHQVEEGAPLYQALYNTGLFPQYLCAMVQVGEETGTLDTVLHGLSDFYEREDALSRTLKSALTYPLITIIMLLLVLFVLLTRVMPVFEGVYAQLGAQIPLRAQNAIHTGAVLTAVCFGILALFGALALGYKIAARRNSSLASVLRSMFVKRSRTARLIAVRRFSEVLSLTVRSGLELTRGLTLTREVTDHPVLQEIIDTCIAGMESGEDALSAALQKSGMFSGLQLQMIAVGLRSGRLDAVFSDIAKRSREDADEAIVSAVNRLEPTLVAVLSIAVGLILLSVMLPLIGMLAAIG